MSHPLASSFRDPNGFVFLENNTLLRQVNPSYKKDYDHFIKSGLYEKLVSQYLLIPHVEKKFTRAKYPHAYKILAPQTIQFISYPYEWTFSQWQDAALTTLKVQKIALEYGMTLKDASFFNIQFYQGRPVLIDSLSFTLYHPGEPWIPYRQFCEHFLAPLALMSYGDIRLGQLTKTYSDGIPLDLAHTLLPFSSYLSVPLVFHIHLHAAMQNKTKVHIAHNTNSFSTASLAELLESLTSSVTRLKWKPKPTHWSAYYENSSYSQRAFADKIRIVNRWLDKTNPKLVWDLGANQGAFSRLASKKSMYTVAFDNDFATVEHNYKQSRKIHDEYLLPLVMDLTNPSPDLGFAHAERSSLTKRGPADIVMALALIHHLAIAGNIPFAKIATFFHRLGKVFIIEFIPKSDQMIQTMLVNREDVFDNYTQTEFERCFKRLFTIKDVVRIKDSGRILYFMQAK